MKRALAILGMLACLAAVGALFPDSRAGAQPCPPGYVFTGPRGCMPAGPPLVPPPPPPPVSPVVRPCPPGTFWSYGACRPAVPPPHYGITINVPPIVIRP